MCCMRIPCESHWPNDFDPCQLDFRRDQRCCPGCSDDTWRGPSCRNGLLCSLWICIFGCRWPMFGCQFVPDLRCWYYPSAAQSVYNWNVQEQKWGRATWFWSNMPKTVHIQPVSCQAMLPTFWSWGSACRWSLETVLVRMESGKFCVYLAGYCVSFLLYTMLLYVSIPACDELQVNMDSNYQQLWSVDCVECWIAVQGVFFQSQLCLPTATAVACALCQCLSRGHSLVITTWILQMGDGVIMFIVWYCMFAACLLYVYCWFHHMTIFWRPVTSAGCRPTAPSLLRHSNLSVSETPLWVR